MYGHIKSLVYDGSFGLFSHSSLSPSSPQSQSLSGEFNSTSNESVAKLFYAHESSSTGSRPSSYTYVRSPASPPRSCTSSHNKVSTPVLQRSLSIHPVQSKLHPPTYLPDTDVHPNSGCSLLYWHGAATYMSPMKWAKVELLNIITVHQKIGFRKNIQITSKHKRAATMVALFAITPLSASIPPEK